MVRVLDKQLPRVRSSKLGFESKEETKKELLTTASSFFSRMSRHLSFL